MRVTALLLRSFCVRPAFSQEWFLTNNEDGFKVDFPHAEIAPTTSSPARRGPPARVYLAIKARALPAHGRDYERSVAAGR
jgi:hypothetical protein